MADKMARGKGSGNGQNWISGQHVVCLLRTCPDSTRLASTRLCSASTKIPINSMRHTTGTWDDFGACHSIRSMVWRVGVAHLGVALLPLFVSVVVCVSLSLCVSVSVCVAKLKPLTFVCASMHYSYAAWPGGSVCTSLSSEG